MTPSIAATSGSKARLSEHRDVRVRAGPLGARWDGKSRQPDVGETVMPAPMALVTFPERKVTRAAGRRGKRHGCRASTCPKASIPLTLPSADALGFPLPQAGEGTATIALHFFDIRARAEHPLTWTKVSTRNRSNR